jgi:hypothetical protein
MDIRDRHFGPIATLTADGNDVVADVDSLIRRILLFEHCVLESSQLREIPTMVKVFGYAGVMRLLDDPNFGIICDAMTAGSVGQTSILQMTERRGGVLPLGSYHVAQISMSTKNGLHDALQNVHQTVGISLRDQKRLKLKLVDRVAKYPLEAGYAGIADYRADIEARGPVLSPIFRSVILREQGIDVGDKLSIEVEKLPFDGDYRVETNLQKDFGLDDNSAHKVVERALLGIAGLNQRIELMKAFNAVTGFQDGEAPIFEAKLNFIFDNINPDLQVTRFDRVSSLAELPSIAMLGNDAKIDINKLLRLRNDPECVELRKWLRTTDGQTDAEIIQQFLSVREKMIEITHSKVGKAVRYITKTAAGLPGHLGLVTGPLASYADKFIVDKLIGSPGPVCFLSRQYRSIFDNK